jgi:8-oxo-dGTP pyrophosphatase MutT (NUDIX family)
MTDELAPDLQYELAYAAPELDRVEAALRTVGHKTLADDLFKLQQDTGLERVESVAASIGKELTAPFLQNYEGDTAARTAYVLRECHEKLQDAELKSWMLDFMTGLGMPPYEDLTPLAAEANRVFNTREELKPYRVGVVMVSPSGAALALKRADDKYCPGTWGTPGGKAKVGETLIEAASRECFEETGRRPRRLIPVIREERDDLILVTMIGVVDEEFTPQLNGEHTDHKWVRPENWPKPAFPAMESVLNNPHALSIMAESAKPGAGAPKLAP